MVKFYPETLVGFDQPIQTAVRGDLPDYLTILFRAITRLIDIPVIITGLLLQLLSFIVVVEDRKFLHAGKSGFGRSFNRDLKNIYQRPRPAILHWLRRRDFPFQADILWL